MPRSLDGGGGGDDPALKLGCGADPQDQLASEVRVWGLGSEIPML